MKFLFALYLGRLTIHELVAYEFTVSMDNKK